jgi:hypothetical protein
MTRIKRINADKKNFCEQSHSKNKPEITKNLLIRVNPFYPRHPRPILTRRYRYSIVYSGRCPDASGF